MPQACRRETLTPTLVRSSLRQGQILAQAGTLIEEIHFPIRSLISTVARLKDGGGIEVGLAGHEGMSALSIAYGSRMSPHVTVVQIEDSAYCMSAQLFIDRMRVDRDLRERAFAYAEYSFNAATQFVACNSLHPIEERFARWILMATDRVVSDELGLTHEYSAQMLGVRRASVTVAAGLLGKAGLIAFRRGHILVLDRPALEAAACECYAVVNAELRRLMGYDIRGRGR